MHTNVKFSTNVLTYRVTDSEGCLGNDVMDKAKYTNIGMTRSGRIRDALTCKCAKKEKGMKGTS